MKLLAMSCLVLIVGCVQPSPTIRNNGVTIRSVWFDGQNRTTLVVEYAGGATGSLTACGIPPVWVGIHGDLFKTWNDDRECYCTSVQR